jgi:tRNA G46 methylase TrmB
MLAPREKLWSTPLEVINKSIELLSDGHSPLVIYDIGAGDGRFLFHCAAMTAVPKIIGVEINKDRVDDIQAEIVRKNLVERCSVIHANALEVNYDDADAVFLYLVPR